MELTAEDRCAIGETIALHGHLFDNGELDRLDELFTPDVVYDVTDVGMAPLHGIAEILRATLELGEGNPLAHHVTNITITDVENECVRTRCKAIAVMPGGCCGSATYIDTLRRDGGHLADQPPHCISPPDAAVRRTHQQPRRRINRACGTDGTPERPGLTPT